MTSSSPRLRTRVVRNTMFGAPRNLGKYDLNFFGTWVHLAGYPETGMHPVGVPSYDSAPYMKAEACVDELHPGPPYRTGGPFRKIKLENHYANSGNQGHGVYFSDPVQFSFSGVGFGPIKYTGGYSNPLFPGDLIDVVNLQQALPTDYLVPDIASLGDSAWDKTKPRIEHAGLGVALAELRDVPKMLQTSGKGFAAAWNAITSTGSRKSSDKKSAFSGIMQPKRVADHYLNTVFGWVPFVKDVHGFIKTVINSDDAISRISEGNGKWQRRRATLINDYRETKIASGEGFQVEPYGSLQEGLMSETPTWEVWEKKSTLATTVGSFIYYRPEFDMTKPENLTLLRRLDRQLTIHGARISPANLYKATPWTWLIDWVSNAGHWVNQVNDYALDNMVARYLYLHHRSYRQVVLKQRLPFRSAGMQTLEFSRIIEVKQRKGAETPYGFGITWDNLTPKQLAILGALGVPRRR
jgi:hypothetical protein